MKFNLQLLFLVFGIAEILSNGYYLFRKKAASLGRKQHSELPPTASDQDVVAKVGRMFVLGIVALTAAAISLAAFEKALIAAPVTMLILIGYEAARYRYWKIYSEFTIVVLLALATAYALYT